MVSTKQFEHIQKIQSEFREACKIERVRDSLNNAIQHLADGLYSERPHFIFELIQNAEDNTYTEQPTYPPFISFRLTKTDPTNSPGSDGALIIQNNEIGFMHDNVSAICAVGKTTKKKEQGYIGEKGIGFKSVFRVTNNPHILSNGYYFSLPESDEETGFGYIVPQWIDTPIEGLDPSETHIILPLTKNDFGYEEIEKMLQDVQPETILFLSKLQEIKIKTDTGDDFTILKDDSIMPEVQIVAGGKKKGVDFSNSGGFLICTGSFDKPADIHHENREGIESRDVTIGFPLDENLSEVKKIFAYLPVKTTDFPFLINADFILTSPREDLQDVPWNRYWLVECVADLIATRLLPLLKKRQLLNVSFLEALAGKLNSLAADKDNLFYPVFKKLRETFMCEELLPANDKTFISAQSAKLADSERLIELLDPHQLSLLFKRSGVTKWLLSDITARRTQNLWKYLRNELNIDEVDPEMFARRIDKPFLEQQPDDWFIDFYKFLFAGERPPKSLWTASSNTYQRQGILRSKPILRLQDNNLVNPTEPNIYLSKGTNSDTTSRLIKSEISQNEDAHKFLKELGVPPWNIVAEVITRILPKYRDNPSAISAPKHKLNFSKIVGAYSTDSQKEKYQLREALLKTPFIFAESSHSSDQVYLRPNQLCFGTDGRIWNDNFTGTYSRLSVSDDICKFLRTLDIPKWDIVDEVIQTILPKYKQNPPRVPIEEHISDFKIIEQAYEACEPFRKNQLITELQTTQFILADCPSADFPIYLRPNQLYIGTDVLQKYFEWNNLEHWIETFKHIGGDITDLLRDYEPNTTEGPTTRAFVRLDKYHRKAHTLFEDLKILDSVRIKKQEKNLLGYVPIVSRHSYHRRGLDGFDPNIEVDGLSHAIDNPTLEKSAFIWNHIALPNADCIKGCIEKSTRQDYNNSSVEDVFSNFFGHLLVKSSWLPDIKGNMHKPSEITLEELPKEFIRDDRLANQLGMKNDEVAEFAEKHSVSTDLIRDLMDNREKYEEFYKELKAEKLRREQSSSPKSDEFAPNTDSPQIDYLTEIEKSFNKSGKTEIQSHIIDDGRVNNPERRREKIAEEHRDRLNREPSAEDRRRETYRTLLEGPDPQVREYLLQMYGGKCQICDHTFPERDGKPFFVAGYIVERQKSGAVDAAANALCLCADHFAKFKHGVIEAADVPTQIENFKTESEGGDCEPILDIKLCGEKCEIRFKEKHLLDLQELIKVSSED